MYTISNSTAYIDGSKGKYDTVIQNPSVRYGRNAVANYYDYLKDYEPNPSQMPKVGNLAGLSEDKFESRMNELENAVNDLGEQIKKLPPVKFEYQYAQSNDGSLDTQALMGASYNETGAVKIPVKTLSKSLRETFSKPNIFIQIGRNIKAFFKGEPREKLELFPAKISVEAFDLNKDKQIDLAEYSVSILTADKLSDGKIDGKINNRGENASLAYINAKNKTAAAQTASELYAAYDLGGAMEEFLKDENNLREV